ncbi:family 78 glycoside hydrolase catalytic domain [Nonomuraea sp. NPDC005650]|uniref:family 78 glycoside hydrolase catalytic domain n=1 Tax=Nonomuraea sp. NPDC005650 TaxID=3157045 RepID=UPI0033A24C2D
MLNWGPHPAQQAAHIVVHDQEGTLIWDSGPVPTTVPRLRYGGGTLTSRSAYRWRVRVIDADGQASAWNDEGRWETPLLRPEDWSATWIGHRAPPGRRIVRSITSDHVAWADSGHWLGQTFTADGPITAVTADLVAELGDDVVGRLELCTLDGEVLAERELFGGPFPWDRFAHYLELDPAPPAGEYLLRVHAERGRIGWRSHTRPPHHEADDGLSPLPVLGTALRDGDVEHVVRAIGVETHPAANPIFRTSFTVTGQVRQARLHAVGLGYGIFRINDEAVTDDVLDPAPTAYDRTILYRSHDVTHLLRIGTNTITAALGRGFYSARGASTWAWNLAPWHREPVLLAQLEYLDEAGTRHVVHSDPTWQAAAGPVVSELLYTGEHHDRLDSPSWEQAIAATPPGGVLRPAPLPPIRRFAPVEPVTGHDISETTTVHDFGTVMAGHITCTLRGQPGAQIIVTYGEHLAADGSVHCDNVLAAGAAQVDRYVLASSEEVTWQPQFTYKGFRYVGIETVGPVAVHDVTAVPLHTDVRKIGRFECGNELLTWIDRATGRTFLNNLHGIPTDTPIYEKNGWTADAHLATEAVLHHFDMRTTLGKWLDDHVDAQAGDGTVPQIVPTPGWGYGPDPAWSASMVLIPWNLYWEYGDLAILDRYVEPICKYVDRMLDLSGDGVWPLHSWGDWLSPGHQFAPEGPAPTATMMLHHVITRAAAICRELGIEAKASRYEQAAQTIASAYHETFFDRRTGTYRCPNVGYRQTMNVLPLAFGTVPAEHAAKVAQGLFDDIELRTGGHLDCGAIGVKYLLPVLSDHGRDDLAITVATQKTRPGWGVWWRAGAQTLLESWDETARSHDHYFLGSVAAWIQQRIAGFRATTPGWASFEVRPVMDDRITWARIAHSTMRGEAMIDWRRTGTAWEVELHVPAGATATLILPGEPGRQLTTGSHRLRG